MHTPSALRRVFKSLSPRRHENNNNNTNHVHVGFVTDSSPSATPPSTPPTPRTASTTQTIEAAYDRLLARLSNRVDGHPLTTEPPSPPSDTSRAISRLHRRAMRDAAPSPPSSSSSDENGKENDRGVSGNTDNNDEMETSDNEYSKPGKHALPPMYIDVDPRRAYTQFVPIGKGGSGSVYFAKKRTPQGAGETVALKKVTPSTSSKAKALENEIKTMHALRHPNIVQCHEAYSYGGEVWIVMEAMNVGCLTHVLDFLREKGYLLSEAHIAYILRDILRGLWSMHSRHCMHRDIKSDNVLVSSDGEVKLGDFEYSAVLTEESPKRNTIVGTAWWMAPETVRSSYYDYGADVWSIGILSIECAEWVPPLFGMESSKAMEVIKSGATIQGFKRPDMWSVEFADFVRGCLVRDRDLRYTVKDLLNHPFLRKACTKNQIANVFRAVRGMAPVMDN